MYNEKIINYDEWKLFISDKTVRVWRWNIGNGFVEESFSPLLGHKYGVTSVRVSPQVSIYLQDIYK